MGFNCDIVGLPNVGKSTLFNAITSSTAGVIHSDFEKGFIRAEIIKSGDLLRLRSEAAAGEAIVSAHISAFWG